MFSDANGEVTYVFVSIACSFQGNHIFFSLPRLRFLCIFLCLDLILCVAVAFCFGCSQIISSYKTARARAKKILDTYVACFKKDMPNGSMNGRFFFGIHSLYFSCIILIF